MRDNRCTLCNAPLRAGAIGCEYCGAGVRGGAGARPPASSPRKAARGPPSWSFLNYLLAGVGLLCCTPCGLYGALYETVYAIQMDTPKSAARPVPLEQRQAEPIEPVQVLRDMRGADGQSLDDRKRTWRERYEGRWVTWSGRVENVLVLDKGSSELRLKPVKDVAYEAQVFLDPAHNALLNPLREGQEVRVSGRLWGYYFMGDTVRLADGLVLGVTDFGPSP